PCVARLVDNGNPGPAAEGTVVWRWQNATP
ncbi:MAG: hypothetical protein QOK39_2211, partial [Acidimicrobiaceae bacterium]|nr:hypothetical protein [Acidimicrobiaceae bacterium]